jgi:hypothetical protein
MEQQNQTMTAFKSWAELPYVYGFNNQAMRMSLWPIQLWLQWQTGMLKAAEQVTGEWMVRRREGAEAALHAVERLTACQDPKDAPAIQSEWIEQETKRLESDWRALGTPALFWRETVEAIGSTAPAGEGHR